MMLSVSAVVVGSLPTHGATDTNLSQRQETVACGGRSGQCDTAAHAYFRSNSLAPASARIIPWS
jgi:hypothetical protein